MIAYIAAMLALTTLVALALALEPLLGSRTVGRPVDSDDLDDLLNSPAENAGPPPPRFVGRLQRGQAIGLAGALAFVGLAVILAAAALRTDDQPASLAVANIGSPATGDLFLSADGDQLVVGGADGIWVGPAGSDSLSRIETLLPRPVAVAPPGSLLLSADGRRFDLSGAASANADWPDVEAVAIASSRSGGRVVLAGIDRSLHLSGDGGQSWRQAGDLTPLGLRALSVSDRDGRIWVATDVQGVLTGDGESGWAGANGFVNGALPTVTVFDIDYDPDSGDSFSGAAGEVFQGSLYAATDAGLFRSRDGGLAWNLIATGFAPAAIYGDGRYSGDLWAAAIDGMIYRSTDGGRNWS